ncbi:MAG TPA: hypothetical protein EYP36_02650 [Calditrichaeota bacterium]|nr:hypothetical protein [Calditrichota bacterium]
MNPSVVSFRRICMLFIFVIALFPATLQAETLTYRNYQFVYNQGDNAFVRSLLQNIQPGLMRIEQFFGYEPVSLVTIYVTRSEAEYNKTARNGIPEWSQAVAFSKEKIIVLKIIGADDIKKAPEILLHELVHIYFAERFPAQRIPNWLNEGLAQLLSGKRLTLQDKVFLAESMAAKKLIGLHGLDTLLTFSRPRARLAYIEALSAVEYFIQTYSYDALKELVKILRNQRSINKAFLSATGYDYIDFEVGWYAWLDEKFRWLLVLNIDNLLWLTMGVLALLAIAVIRWRNRRKLAQWESEEPEGTEIELRDKQDDGNS